MNDKKILTDAIKQLGLLAQVKVMWVVTPLLEDMAIKFAGYVGPHAKSASGKCLLHVGLKEAIAKYQVEMDKVGDEQAAIASFVKTLLAYGSQVFSQRMVAETKEGDIAWMPFFCGAVEFMDQYPNFPITCERIDSTVADSIASVFIMTKIIPPSLLNNASLAELLNDAREKEAKETV